MSSSRKKWAPDRPLARHSRPLPIISLALFLAGLAWLIFQFFTQPLATQDQIASVASMLLGILGFAVDQVRNRRALDARPGATSAPFDRNAFAEEKLRELAARHGGLPRIGDSPADPINLRVHAALQLETEVVEGKGKRSLIGWILRHIQLGDQRPDPYLPTYVDREIWPQLNVWAEEAAKDGGFLVLVGDSAVGKTRLLYELALAKFPKLFVVAPTLGDASVVNALAEADFPLPPLLIWLDEFHRFLAGRYLPEGGVALQASALERLLKAPTPVVLLGAYWPGHSQYFRALSRGSLAEPEPQNPVAYQIVSNPRLVELRLDSFSQNERRRAAILASQDSRLADAIADPDYNVTEALAGAPRIMGLYRGATMTGRALLPAAIDARRIGYQWSFTKEMLQTASAGYLRPAETNSSWFEEAFRTALRVDRGASALIQVLGVTDSGNPRYSISDYLLQRASRERRSCWPAATVWEAAIHHTSDVRT